ncbi:MAG: pseudaminic acid biosynthesis N-acetyl transferase [Bacillales bacterium]|jgi:UDP-4-amino-4,6-dideoxy-N-acetyl-beta-L-altrosamine N-acetyltransferase|nr:pseudaminic acid biosynthesis N-acetyl transferase [Bacillales bacterium]
MQQCICGNLRTVAFFYINNFYKSFKLEIEVEKMLIGEKILLRPIEMSDTEDVLRWRNNSEVRKNFVYQELLTKEDHISWMQNMVETKKVVQFIIVDKDTNQSVGSVFLRDIDLKNQKAEYGIFIGEVQAHGKGFGTEAAKLINGFGFDELKLNKIFLRVFADNHAGIKSYSKAGFVEEGLFRQDVKIGDKYRDMVFMACFNLKNDMSVL